jgi:hypothetical protein
MLSEQQQEDLRKAVLNHLAHQQGWRLANVFGLEFAHKSFETAVGPKEARAVLQPTQQGGWRLTGHYESEGRNVLSTCDVHIAADDEVPSAIEKFSNEVEHAVRESYAANLWILQQRQRG